LKNMYIIQEENKDLRADLTRLKKLTYDDKIKEMVEENQTIRKRNGMLLVQNDELSSKLVELKEQMTGSTIITTTNGPSTPERSGMKEKQIIAKGLVRPQTAAGAFGRGKKDARLLDDDDLYHNAQSQIDRDLNDLLARNQSTLNELHADMKEVSKIAGEPTFNVRKMKNQQHIQKIDSILK